MKPKYVILMCHGVSNTYEKLNLELYLLFFTDVKLYIKSGKKSLILLFLNSDYEFIFIRRMLIPRYFWYK